MEDDLGLQRKSSIDDEATGTVERGASQGEQGGTGHSHRECSPMSEKGGEASVAQVVSHESRLLTTGRNGLNCDVNVTGSNDDASVAGRAVGTTKQNAVPGCGDGGGGGSPCVFPPPPDERSYKPQRREGTDRRINDCIAGTDADTQVSFWMRDMERAGGLGARDDLGSAFPVAMDATDREAALRDYDDADYEYAGSVLGPENGVRKPESLRSGIGSAEHDEAHAARFSSHSRLSEVFHAATDPECSSLLVSSTTHHAEPHLPPDCRSGMIGDRRGLGYGGDGAEAVVPDGKE
ncbi:hypothetical protein CBR_g41355 [Chara braunii]|uniref:Uncharacterized protein n=1 Tax=Chara braunii TaxID=69332 RepID=A0A388LVK8_CHABU|nr:hypothetical protein CBR_g41355 [Chara braunii]|eukprot:GBG86360.1 hypothetical protein CBR_g41355 [Chara braunii]